MTLTTEMTAGFTEVFNLLKESVTYKTITRGYDSNDDLTESAVDTSIYVVMEIIDLDTFNDFGGDLKVGDAIVYFPNTATVNKNDKIVHNSITYIIDKPIPHNSGSTVVFYEVHVKREH